MGKINQIPCCDWLPKQTPSCPLGTTHCVPQEKFPWKPLMINSSQTIIIKMAEYWSCSFMHLAFISNHAKKKLVNIQPSCPPAWLTAQFVWAYVESSHHRELIFILNLGRHISCIIGDKKTWKECASNTACVRWKTVPHWQTTPAVYLKIQWSDKRSVCHPLFYTLNAKTGITLWNLFNLIEMKCREF